MTKANAPFRTGIAMLALTAVWSGLGAGPASGSGLVRDDPGNDPHARIWSPEEWAEIVAAAEGQTVYFHAWGGSSNINAYLEWAADELETRYDIDLRHVRVTDTADVVATVLAERAAGRDTGGSVDLVWINGENFAAMKDRGLLGEPFAHRLPNFAHVDPVRTPAVLTDFTVPTEGLESPWGLARIVFMHDTAVEPEPPRSIPALLDYVQENPGRFTYPQPPDFLGLTFLKQALLELADTPDVLSRPVESQEQFDEVTAPLWAYLDALHPDLWRGGRAFPTSGPALAPLLDDREIAIAFNYNPEEASALIENGELPDTVRTYVLEGGSLGNAHFLSIPYNANAREGALVVADFFLSPEAQARKADPTVWGDPTVLSMDLLSPEDRALFDALPRGIATLAPEEMGLQLDEPHPSWTDALEAAWAERYVR